MSWLNDYTKATFQIYEGQVLEGFQPLDFFHFYPLFYDLWIDNTVDVLKKINAEEKTYKELKEFLPVPSSMRAILQKVIPVYQALPNKNKENIKYFTSFFARMLVEACPTDPFGQTSTPLHGRRQIDAIITSEGFIKTDTVLARTVGQLITVAGSYGHGVYNDLVIDFAWDAYGPYNVVKGNNAKKLLIRHFTNLQPIDLGWNTKDLASVNEIKIFAVYENVDWKINCIGCHTTALSGSPVQGMRYVKVIAGRYPKTYTPSLNSNLILL